MARHCQKCGAEIPEGSPVCRSCFEPVKPEGFLRRLWRSLTGGWITVAKSSQPPGTRVTFKLSARFKIRDPFTGKTHEYKSLDETPPELREQLQRAQEALARPHGENTIIITDAAGNTHTYHSPDEMPPEMRALYDRARTKSLTE